ncbi:hypothetical protein WR25_00089 [Diploscapter pachys]|uniref:Uncharacterized protein n=1 Tax=Diploscapter pachys TaxID=2018661 RepID=A0A2A2KE36_9BILA|nr:hypothetical protein WR25_00089 [Diploscapter pachys]
MSIKKGENNTNPPTDEQKKTQQQLQKAEEEKNLPSPFPSEDSGMFTPTSPAQQPVITANLGLQKLEDYAEQSIRLDQRASGEALNECTDAEWLSGEDAYPQELLEVKKKPNKVSVFVARGGQGGSDTKTARDKNPSPDDTERDDVDAVTKLVSKITKVFLEDKSTEGVEVQVTMRVANGPKKNLTE